MAKQRSELFYMVKAAKERARENARALKACTRHGVFEWTGENRYPAEKAIGGKLYKSEKLAQKAADKGYADGKNWVVRTVRLCNPKPE